MTKVSIQGILKETKKSLVRKKNVPNYRAKTSLVLVIATHGGHEQAAWHSGVAFRVKVDKARSSVLALTQSRESEESAGEKGDAHVGVIGQRQTLGAKGVPVWKA